MVRKDRHAAEVDSGEIIISDYWDLKGQATALYYSLSNIFLWNPDNPEIIKDSHFLELKILTIQLHLLTTEG